jgi:hypothetical protein
VIAIPTKSMANPNQSLEMVIHLQINILMRIMMIANPKTNPNVAKEVPLVLQVLKDLKETKVLKVHKETKDLKALKVLKVIQEQKVCKVP